MAVIFFSNDYYYLKKKLNSFNMKCTLQWCQRIFFLNKHHKKCGGCVCFSANLGGDMATSWPELSCEYQYKLFDLAEQISKKLLHNACITKLNNVNFYPFEVVSCYRDPQFQVGDNYSFCFNLRPNIFKSCFFFKIFSLFQMSVCIRFRQHITKKKASSFAALRAYWIVADFRKNSKFLKIKKHSEKKFISGNKKSFFQFLFACFFRRSHSLFLNRVKVFYFVAFINFTTNSPMFFYLVALIHISQNRLYVFFS